MSGPIAALRTAFEAKFTSLFQTTPIRYGFREVAKTRSLDAVTLGHGRIVWHAGTWPGPEANAGEIEAAHGHPTTTGRSVSNSWNIFTVHCHGLDPAFPDPTADGAEAAHDDVAWRLREMFFGQLPEVVSGNRWLLRYGAQVWIRDPEQQRLGEVLKCEFAVKFAIRSLPVYPKTQFTQEPTGVVKTVSGNETTIVGGA